VLRENLWPLITEDASSYHGDRITRRVIGRRPAADRAALAPPVGPTQLAQPAGTTEKADLLRRVRSYLGNGGLFNPEAMAHDKVRDLVMDLANALASPPRRRAGAGLATD
jgi:hypothetical protein